MSNYVLCKTWTGFVLFWGLQIQRLSLTFPWPYQVFCDLRFSCHFPKMFKTFLTLGYFLTFNSSKDTNSGVHQKACCSRFSLSYIVLALSSTVTNLPNKTLIFHDFQQPTIKFHDFPGLGNEILKFHDFPGFPLPVRRWFQRILHRGQALMVNMILLFQKVWSMCRVGNLLIKPIAFSYFHSHCCYQCLSAP